VGGLLAIKLQCNQLQREAIQQSFIPMEGFSYLNSQFAVGAVSMVLPACMWGAPSWVALGDFGLVYQLSLGCYCIRFHYILYLLYSIFCFPHIYIYIPN
jgi:hypothetical protein